MDQKNVSVPKGFRSAWCLVYRVYTILTFYLGFVGKSGPIV